MPDTTPDALAAIARPQIDPSRALLFLVYCEAAALIRELEGVAQDNRGASDLDSAGRFIEALVKHIDPLRDAVGAYRDFCREAAEGGL